MIDAPIGRSTARRTRMAVREPGKARAHRRTRCDRTFDEPRAACSSARSRPGARIRSACTSPRSAIPSSATRPTAASASSIALDRPFLHAAHLAFDHPATGESMSVRRTAAGRADGRPRRAARKSRSTLRRRYGPTAPGWPTMRPLDEFRERDLFEVPARLVGDADPDLLQDAVAFAVVGMLGERELRPFDRGDDVGQGDLVRPAGRARSRRRRRASSAPARRPSPRAGSARDTAAAGACAPRSPSPTSAVRFRAAPATAAPGPRSRRGSTPSLLHARVDSRAGGTCDRTSAPCARRRVGRGNRSRARRWPRRRLAPRDRPRRAERSSCSSSTGSAGTRSRSTRPACRRSPG